MTTIVSEPVSLLLYVPQWPTNYSHPVGEFRGTKTFYGDASGGYVCAQFTPANLVTGQQYVWLWMAGHIAAITSAAQDPTISEILRLDTGEAGGLVFAQSNLCNNSTTYIYQHAAYTGAFNNAGIRIPHRPDGSVGTGNTFNCVFTHNYGAGVGYKASVWGFVYHPECRTRAGGPFIPSSI